MRPHEPKLDGPWLNDRRRAARPCGFFEPFDFSAQRASRWRSSVNRYNDPAAFQVGSFRSERISTLIHLQEFSVGFGALAARF